MFYGIDIDCLSLNIYNEWMNDGIVVAEPETDPTEAVWDWRFQCLLGLRLWHVGKTRWQPDPGLWWNGRKPAGFKLCAVAPPPRDLASRPLTLRVAIQDLMTRCMQSHQHQYIFEPVCASVLLRRNTSKEPLRPRNSPRIESQVQLEPTSLRMSQVRIKTTS